MSTVNIVLLVILAVLIVGLIVLYFLGKKAQKKRRPRPSLFSAKGFAAVSIIFSIPRNAPSSP